MGRTKSLQEAYGPFNGIRLVCESGLWRILIGKLSLAKAATRLADIFRLCRTRNCVLFFDEFDYHRQGTGDREETRGDKRVVSSLLLQMDRLPSYVVVIRQVIIPELLDRAV